jgi:hypothetical protein
LDNGVFWISLAEYKKSMLYMTVSHYREGWWQSFIFNEGDDGLKHTFVFDVDSSTAGEAQIRLDHYDVRMYPYGTKT